MLLLLLLLLLLLSSSVRRRVVGVVNHLCVFGRPRRKSVSSAGDEHFLLGHSCSAVGAACPHPVPLTPYCGCRSVPDPDGLRDGPGAAGWRRHGVAEQGQVGVNDATSLQDDGSKSQLESRRASYTVWLNQYRTSAACKLTNSLSFNLSTNLPQHSSARPYPFIDRTHSYFSAVRTLYVRYISYLEIAIGLDSSSVLCRHSAAAATSI